MNVVVYFLCRRKACLPGPCRPIISGPDFISAAFGLMIIRLPLQYRNNMIIIKCELDSRRCVGGCCFCRYCSDARHADAAKDDLLSVYDLYVLQG